MTALELMDLPQSQIDQEWERFVELHIDPCRLFKLAFGLIEQSDRDRKHLEECDSCRRVFNAYQQ